jgi:hypothetical protein
MEDPVMLVQSGQTYDRKHLLIALAHHKGVDPVTQIKFSEKPQLCINYALKSLIEKYKAQSVSSASPVVVDNQYRCPPSIWGPISPQTQKDTSLIVPFTVMHPYTSYSSPFNSFDYLFILTMIPPNTHSELWVKS